MTKVLKILTLSILVIMVLFVALIGGMVCVEPKLVFNHGTARPLRMRPDDAIDLQVEGLDCWLLPSKIETHKVILVCHGKSGHMGHRIRLAQLMQTFAHVVLFDYSGFGNSSGSPTEKQVYQDTHKVWLRLVEEVSPAEIVVYGRSLGGPIATELVQWIQAYYPHKMPHSLVLDSTFTTLVDVGKEQNALYRFVLSFFSSLATCKFETIKRIANIDVPILIMHGQHDDVIPIRQAHELHKKAPNSKLVVLEHGNHKTSYYKSQNAFLSALTSFIC